MKKVAFVHEMKLDKRNFELMEQGVKTIELRLLDEKRRLLQLGDRITFKLFPTLDHSCTMEVIGLLHYPDFASMIGDIDVSWLGYGEEKREWLKTSMSQVYTEEEQRELTALGIRLRKVSK
jgi:ASC-1-like (ASCH) protein